MTATTIIQIGDRKISIYDDAPINLPDLTDNDWRQRASEVWDNGVYSVHAFALVDGRTLWVDCDQGVPLSVEVGNLDIVEHLRRWDHDGHLAEWLAEFGLDGLSVLTRAEEDYDGPCRVWHEPCYYQGTYNAPRPGFAREDDSDEIREFTSRAAAQEYVNEYYTAPSGYDGVPACNVLSHGQAGADQLTIVEAD